MSYDYSFTQERALGTTRAGESAEKGKPRYRGRCGCGRSTHRTYSTAGLAINAIRFVHNQDIPGEECNAP